MLDVQQNVNEEEMVLLDPEVLEQWLKENKEHKDEEEVREIWEFCCEISERVQSFLFDVLVFFFLSWMVFKILKTNKRIKKTSRKSSKKCLHRRVLFCYRKEKNLFHLLSAKACSRCGSR